MATVVGVDLGSSTIRAAEVSDADKLRPTLQRYFEVPVPEGAIVRGEVQEPNTVATLLRQLWSRAGFKSKRVVLGMGNQRVLARDLTIPRAPLARIRETLPYQVQEVLPMPVADALLDFYPISEEIHENGPMVTGLLIAAVKDAVLGNVQAVESAGLTVVGVDLIPFALDRILLRRGGLGGLVALVEIGASTTNVLVAQNGVPQFVRIIPNGGQDLTNMIAARLEMPKEQAEAMKRQLGLAKRVSSVQEQQVVEVTYEIVSELLSTLRNTISYYVSTKNQGGLTSIVLSGGAANLPGFAEALAEYTRIPVVLGDPLAGIGVSRGAQLDPSGTGRNTLSVAIGLAVKEAAA